MNILLRRLARDSVLGIVLTMQSGDGIVDVTEVMGHDTAMTAAEKQATEAHLHQIRHEFSYAHSGLSPLSQPRPLP